MVIVMIMLRLVAMVMIMTVVMLWLLIMVMVTFKLMIMLMHVLICHVFAIGIDVKLRISCILLCHNAISEHGSSSTTSNYSFLLIYYVRYI